MSDHETHDDLQPTTADVGAERVAKVYAEAFLNAAQKRNQSDVALEELESLIRDVFRADSHLEAFFSSGAIGRDCKAKVIRSTFEGRTSEVVTNFLLVLNEHDRLDLLRPILDTARELRDQRARRIRVHVRTAVPLPNDQRERLRLQLRDSLHLEPLLEIQIDRDLLGGLVVRIGDWLYDGSVRTQLENICHQLIERSNYAIQSRRDRFSSADGD